jgi:hypothetical protein
MPNQLAKNAFLLDAAVVLLLPLVSFSQEDTRERQPARERRGTVSLRVEVTGGEPAEPVASAAVYVKSEEDAHRDPPTYHTNRQGLAQVPNVPRGKVLIQVTKIGWRNFGQHYDLDQEGPVIKIRMERERAPSDR